MVHAVTDTSRNTHDHGENQAETEDPKQSIAIDDQLPTTQTSALDQNFSLLSITGIALTTGESWIVVGNSLVCQHLDSISSINILTSQWSL